MYCVLHTDLTTAFRQLGSPPLWNRHEEWISVCHYCARHHELVLAGQPVSKYVYSLARRRISFSCGCTVAVGFAFCFGRIYSLTMLYNLNTRKHGRHTGNSDNGYSGGTHTTGDLRDGAINLSGIRESTAVSSSR